VTYDASLDAPLVRMPGRASRRRARRGDRPCRVAADAPGTGLSCASGCNDGLSCTRDSCVNGICQNALNPTTAWSKRRATMDGDTDPNDPCKACTTTTSTSLWTPKPEGTTCGTWKSCQSDTCTACGNLGQACCGRQNQEVV